MRIRHIALAAIGLACSVRALAADYSNSTVVLPATKQPQLSLALESVADRVAYSPNLAGGGYASAKHKYRYVMQALAIDWPISTKHTIQTQFSSHRIHSLRDSINVNQIGFGVRRNIRVGDLNGNTELGVHAKYSFTDVFNKNSYTHIDQGIITSANIYEPNDFSVAADFRYSKALSTTTTVTTQSILGYQQTKFKTIAGTGSTNNGCKLEFNVAQSGGSISQTDVCGQVQSYQQLFPEIQYQAFFFEQRASVSKAVGSKNTLHGAYGIRVHSRTDIDDTSSGYQHSPVNTSQTFTIGLMHQMTHSISLQASAFYRVAPFLDKIPFLYTRYTAHRYQKSTPSYSVSAHYAFR